MSWCLPRVAAHGGALRANAIHHDMCALIDDHRQGSFAAVASSSLMVAPNIVQAKLVDQPDDTNLHNRGDETAPDKALPAATHGTHGFNQVNKVRETDNIAGINAQNKTFAPSWLSASVV